MTSRAADGADPTLEDGGTEASQPPSDVILPAPVDTEDRATADKQTQTSTALLVPSPPLCAEPLPFHFPASPSFFSLIVSRFVNYTKLLLFFKHD